MTIGILLPWFLQFDLHDRKLAALAFLSGTIWWLVLLWAFHHLAFQIGALFFQSRKKTDGQQDGQTSTRRPKIAVLYATCNDFGDASCSSCISQDYGDFHVFVCDDSTQIKYRQQVEAFCASHSGQCTLITRSDNRDFKAGNLNNAVEKHATDAEWLMLVDADQVLPKDYLSRLAAELPDDEDVAFVQAGNRANPDGTSSPFQSALSAEVSLFYSRDMPLRQSFGFRAAAGTWRNSTPIGLERPRRFP